MATTEHIPCVYGDESHSACSSQHSAVLGGCYRQPGRLLSCNDAGRPSRHDVSVSFVSWLERTAYLSRPRRSCGAHGDAIVPQNNSQEIRGGVGCGG